MRTLNAETTTNNASVQALSPGFAPEIARGPSSGVPASGNGKAAGNGAQSGEGSHAITLGRVPPFRVAIVGGGPGGLFTAWYLAGKLGPSAQITIYEGSDRLGGKIITNEIPGVGNYEAGVAEIYDYAHLGPDPLRELIEQDLGLEIKHIKPAGCVLDGRKLPTIESLEKEFGREVYESAVAFKNRCARQLKPTDYYKAVRKFDNSHPWGQVSGEDILDREIDNDIARRYVRVMAHSDVAAPPHLTTGLTFLKNALMDTDGYIDLYSVVGGNQQIVERLVNLLDADIRLHTTVTAVQPMDDNTARLTVVSNGKVETIEADFVVLCAPLTALSIIEYKNTKLHRAMVRHINHFDRPGHYLRATLVFERPFWREHFDGAWFMHDAFDGCALYDEGARHDVGAKGVLGFLIAGNAALGMANFSDERIEEMCLDALAPAFPEARKLLLDRRIHRWMASVNSVPGGVTIRERSLNHRPEPSHPQVLVVGDYIFDATLNGVLDSAEAACDLIVTEALGRRRAARDQVALRSGTDAWYPTASEQLHGPFFSGLFLAQTLNLVWGLRPGAKVLSIGANAGVTVAALRELGFDAYGIELDRFALARAPQASQEYTQLGDPTDLPIPDRHFDAVIDTGLCYLPRAKVGRAIAELRRITRCGVMLGSVVSDLPVEMIERQDLLANVKTFGSRWDWADEFYAHDFEQSLTNPDRLAEVWKCAQAYGAGPGAWYEEAEAMLYSFYNVEGVHVSKHTHEPKIEYKIEHKGDHKHEHKGEPRPLSIGPLLNPVHQVAS
jgi:monoamine oxidase/SAM-dependent methyltransferase